MIIRRQLLLGAASSIAIVIGSKWLGGRTVDAAAAFEIVKTDAEWRKLLTPAQYNVLRRQGTERAGSSPLDHEKRKGIFQCAGCDLPLFSSDTRL